MSTSSEQQNVYHVNSSAAGGTSSGNSYQVLGIAARNGNQNQKDNKYELIACGDYNSYTIINI